MDKEAKKISVSLTFDQLVHVLLSLDERRKECEDQIKSIEHIANTSANPKVWDESKEYYQKKHRDEIELMEEIRKQMKGGQA